MMIYYGVFRQPYYHVDEVKLHSGGEATIHRVVGHPGLIAKIYHEERLSSTPTAREDMKQKVVAMINLPLQTQEDGNLLYAWPTDLLFSEKGSRFCGYVMPLVDGSPLLSALRLNEREQISQPNYSTIWSVLLARNLASVVNRAHATGIVIGDFQPLNMLTGPQATVTIIDCDSFGVRADTGRWFPPVAAGVDCYLPPEILMSHSYKFSVVTDRFSLAVEIFMVLFNGCHPFCADGRLEDNIVKGFVPYFMPGQHLPAEAPDIDWVGPRLKNLFHRAFLGPPPQRPTALEWRTALEELLTELRQPTARCSFNPNHRFVRAYISPSGCPWCAADNRLKKSQKQFHRPATPAPKQTPPSPPPSPAPAPSTGTRIFQNANPGFKRLGTVHAVVIYTLAVLLPAVASQADIYRRAYVDSGLELYTGFSDLMLLLAFLLTAKIIRATFGKRYQTTQAPVVNLLKSVALLCLLGPIMAILLAMGVGALGVCAEGIFALIGKHFAALAFIIILGILIYVYR